MFTRTSLLILAPVLTLGLAACRPDPIATDRADAPTLAVQTAVVQSMPGPGTRALPATVRPVEVASLAAQVSGTVATHEAPLGRAVTAGTVLLTLQAPALEAGVAQARAALDLATAEHAREARLLTQGASTTETVRRLDDQRRIAAAALAQAEAQLAYTRVVAPFAGVVTARHVEPGDTVAPGRPLVALEGRDARRVEVAVPASWPEWPLGTAIDIQVEGADAGLRGQLAEFSPSADPATRTRLAKIDLPTTAALASGTFVRVLWPVDATPRISVPEAAVVTFGQLTRVQVVREGRAYLRLVQPGPSHDGQRLIFAGLDVGETVILNPPAGLRDGQPVESQR